MKNFLFSVAVRRAAGIIAVLPLAAVGAGCVSGRSGGHGKADLCPAGEQLPPGGREGGRILRAFKEKDYGIFCSAVPEELAAGVSQKDFEKSVAQINRQFGELQEFAYLTSLSTPGFSNLLWKTAFVRDSADGRRKIRQELLFRVIAGNNGSETQVISFGFL